MQVDATILKDNKQNRPARGPREDKNSQRTDSWERQTVSGGTVSRERGVCRQNLLPHWRGCNRALHKDGADAGPSAAERRVVTHHALLRPLCPHKPTAPETHRNAKKDPQLLSKTIPASSRNINLSFYNSSSNINLLNGKQQTTQHWTDCFISVSS